MIHRYVDTAADGTGDGTTRGHTTSTGAYASLSSWESSEQTTLTDDHTVHCAGSTADTTNAVIAGWTVSGYALKIAGDRGDDHSGESGDDATGFDNDGFYSGANNWSTSHYRLEAAYVGALLYMGQNDLVVDGIQVSNTTTAGYREAIGYSGTVSLTVIENCRVTMPNGGAACSCIGDEGSILNDRTFTIRNNIIFNGVYGIAMNAANFRDPVVNIYNNTVYGMSSFGIRVSTVSTNTAVYNIKNNAVSNCGLDLSDALATGSGTTANYDANAFEEYDLGTNGEVELLPTPDTEADVWADPGSGQTNSLLHLSGSTLDNTGVNVGITTDIRGESRSGYDIGAFEVTAAGGGWTGTVNGVTNPGSVNDVTAANITNVMGVT